VGRDLACHIAAIEILEARISEMLEGGGERCLLEPGSWFRRLAVDQKHAGKAWEYLELRKFLRRQPYLAWRDDIIPGMPHGGCEQRRKWPGPPPGPPGLLPPPPPPPPPPHPGGR